MIKYIVMAVVLALGVYSVAFASVTPYRVICHHTPSNQVTHSFANEQSYNGHLGSPHSGSTFDTDGPCTEPSDQPSEEPTPEGDGPTAEETRINSDTFTNGAGVGGGR